METKVDPDAILVAEYEYISQSAFQANEDRAKVATLFLLSVASFLGAMLTAPSLTAAGQQASLAFSALFVVLAIYAGLTLGQLIRLREAWQDSVIAMNKIKDYYLAQAEAGDQPLADAFAWGSATIPKKFKPWSVSFMLALQVAVLGAASLGAAVMFLGYALSRDLQWWSWLFAGLLAFFYFVGLMAIYR